MLEELSTQEWFFLALAAGTGFLVVRHFMDKLPRGPGGGPRRPQEPPTQPPPQHGTDASPWFRGDTRDGDDAASDGRANGGVRTDNSSAHVPPLVTPSAPWYRVLDVSPTAPVADIKSAYRRKLRLYHPDKLAGLGPEFTAVAETKANEVAQAYKQACAARGIVDPAP